jgi:hypothetical protein
MSIDTKKYPCAPLPPRSIMGAPHKLMTMSEVEHWAASYNDWVALWNKHEKSRDLPLGPEWAEAEWDYYRPVISAIRFRTRDTGRIGIMRFRGHHPFVRGWSFCRCPVELDRLVWAGWDNRRFDFLSVRDLDVRYGGAAAETAV